MPAVRPASCHAAVPLVRDLAAGVDLARAHVPVGGNDEAIGREQQRDRHLRDRIGVAARRVQHRDLRRGRGRDVDVVGIAPARADHPQVAVEDRCVHEVGFDDEDLGAVLTDARGQLLAVEQAQRHLFDPRVVDDVCE